MEPTLTKGMRLFLMSFGLICVLVGGVGIYCLITSPHWQTARQMPFWAYGGMATGIAVCVAVILILVSGIVFIGQGVSVLRSARRADKDQTIVVMYVTTHWSEFDRSFGDFLARGCKIILLMQENIYVPDDIQARAAGVYYFSDDFDLEAAQAKAAAQVRVILSREKDRV